MSHPRKLRGMGCRSGECVGRRVRAFRPSSLPFDADLLCPIFGMPLQCFPALATLMYLDLILPLSKATIIKSGPLCHKRCPVLISRLVAKSENTTYCFPRNPRPVPMSSRLEGAAGRDSHSHDSILGHAHEKAGRHAGRVPYWAIIGRIERARTTPCRAKIFSWRYSGRLKYLLTMMCASKPGPASPPRRWPWAAWRLR